MTRKQTHRERANFAEKEVENGLMVQLRGLHVDSHRTVC